MRATRQDFWEFVRIVRSLERGTTRRLMWGIALSKVLKSSNPRFDEKAFIDACATEEAQDMGQVIELFSKKGKRK
jgi:hypothetical protein